MSFSAFSRAHTIPERFEARVDRSGDCWVWTGSGNDRGYGQFWDGKKNRAAHRFAYELWVGPIPEGLEIDHVCKNTSCVRPDPQHCEAVTPEVNHERSLAASIINRAKTHCPRDHEYAGANLSVLPSGERRCRTCEADRQRGYRAARRTGDNTKVGPNDQVRVG